MIVSGEPEVSASKAPARTFGPILGSAWVIFALALIVRIAWVAVHRGPLLEDETEFMDVARSLIQGNGYVSSSYRTNPVQPVYLAAIHSVFGEKWMAARLGQALIGAGTCVLLCRLGSHLGGRKTGWLSGLALALYPGHIYLSALFYVECLLIALLVLSALLAVLALRRGRPIGWCFATGVAVGLTVLSRASMMAFLPCVCAVWLYASPLPLRRRLAMCGVYLLATILVVVPWIVRNHRVHGLYMISSGFATKLWQGNNELANGSAFDRDIWWNENDTGGWEQRLAQLDPATQQAIREKYAVVDAEYRHLYNQHGDVYLASDKALSPIVRDYILSNPGRIMQLFGLKMLTLYSAYSDTLLDHGKTSMKRIVAAVTFYPILALAIVGAVLGWRQRRRYLMVYLLILSISAAYCMLNTCTRFRLPLDPFLMILAATTFARAWNRLARRAIPASSPSPPP